MLLNLFLGSLLLSAPPSLTVEACHVHLTEAGRSAAFKSSVVFRVYTNDQGSVSKIEPVYLPPVMVEFVMLEEFKSCVARWELEPGTSYLVSLLAGTTGEVLEYWSIVICHQGSNCLVVRVPRSVDPPSTVDSDTTSGDQGQTKGGAPAGESPTSLLFFPRNDDQFKNAPSRTPNESLQRTPTAAAPRPPTQAAVWVR